MDIRMKLIVVEFITKCLHGEDTLQNSEVYIKVPASKINGEDSSISVDVSPLGQPWLSHIPCTVPGTSSVPQFLRFASVAACTLHQKISA